MRWLAIVVAILLAFGAGLITGRTTVKSAAPETVATDNSLPVTPPSLPPSDVAGAPPPAKDSPPTKPPPGFDAPPPAGVSFAPPTYDYGRLLEGEARNCTLKIIRPAGTALKLGRIYCACPCIVATTEKRDFAATEDAVVKVALHSLTLEGRKLFPLYLEVIEPAKGILPTNLTLDATRVPAKIAIVPDTLHFGSARAGKTTSVKLLNLTKRPLTLRSPHCSIAGVEVSVKDLFVGPGLEATVAVTIPQAGVRAGPVQGTISLETDCREHARVEIPIDGTALTGPEPAQ